MAFIPVTLLGDNLGQRHQYLNSLVREAKESGVLFHDIEVVPEQSPVDRLFKIDLAAKLKNVDYIIRNLKDDDMLYVSRALKSTWLIDQRDIINPKYLEDVLFPSMVTPAVSKTKHWLYINLRDPAMCQEFFQYYGHDKFEFALKFLSHCSNEFILDEVLKILSKLTPHTLKVLSEKCPKVAKLYFDSLATDEDVRSQYLNQQQSFYNNVKCVLKTDADVFLDITEKYFNINSFSRLSPVLTDYIMRCHKLRFTNKLELYVAYLLHIPTVADRLSIEECQEVVLKLARAKYLQHWFEYKVLEPLIKRISPDKRAAFKKRVFVEKDVGDQVHEWPYETPEPLSSPDNGLHVFDDKDFMPVCGIVKRKITKRVCKKRGTKSYCIISESCIIGKNKSELDRLFDEFRFIGLDRALHDLRQRIGASSSADRRRDMFLVLVSKSGGRNDAVAALLRLAARHSNEPAHFRAAVLRSLVKRANVWRLSADVWQHLLNFGHALGLDGSTPEAACIEGLHAVVIRQLLSGECESGVRLAFLSNFSTLTEYSLNPDERVRVAIGLQKMLIAAASEEEPDVAAQHLGLLLDVLEIYKVRIKAASATIEAVKKLTSHDADVARPLLERLYKMKIARRDLLRVNLQFRLDQAALLNALRHDPPALELNRVVEILGSGETCCDSFISKLVVYFNQQEDIATQLCLALKEKFLQEQNIKVARALVSILGNDFEVEIGKLSTTSTESFQAAALKEYAQCSRPIINLANWGWQKAGVKALASQAMRCRKVERADLIRALSAQRRTIKAALAVSICYDELLLETFASAVKLYPAATMKSALSYFRRCGSAFDFRVWDIVKPIFSTVDRGISTPQDVRRLLDGIPNTIKPDHCATLYFAIDKVSPSTSGYVLRDLAAFLPKVSDEAVENILQWVLEKTDKDPIPYPVIFIRYLMLSRNEDEFEKRFMKIGNRFLERLDILRCEGDSNFTKRLNQTINGLKYNAAILDPKFTSCYSMIERILTWIQKFMPKEEYLKKYVRIHLTMLYYKAVRQSMKQMPEIFADLKRLKSEGVDAVGFVFGRYIAKEVAELGTTYFDSIIELYTEVLVDYLGDDYFLYGNSRVQWIGAVLKGIWAGGIGGHRRMVIYVLKDYRCDIKEPMRAELIESMANDKDVEFFVNAELFN